MPSQSKKTVVSFDRQAVLINGAPTYPGRTWNGRKIEGLLLNARFVQATFHDENPETATLWTSPHGRPFDPAANTDVFIAMLPEWHASGLRGFTINLQGGSPQGYSKVQPWRNSAFAPDGSLKPAYMSRIARVIDAANRLGVVVMLGLFYFGQTPHFENEDAIVRALDNATDWLITRGETHVLIEIANECDHWLYPPIIRPERVVELITRVQERSKGKLPTPPGRLLVSTSLLGQAVPSEAIVAVADYLLIHGNGTKSPQHFREQIRRTRQVTGYRDQPVICNEDDHFDFDKGENNFVTAVEEYCGWGYFDYRMANEAFEEGYQSLPVDWTTNSARKCGFFKLLSAITGSTNLHESTRMRTQKEE